MGSDAVEAHGHARTALSFAERSGNAALEHRALRCMAEAEERMGLFAEFMKTTLRALQLSQSMGDPKAIAEDLRELSSAYLLNAMPEKAVEEARNSLAMILPTQSGAVVEEAQRFLIHTLLQAGRHDEVLRTSERCLQRARERGDGMEEARLSHLVGASLLAQRKYYDAITYLSKAERPISSAGTALERFTLRSDIAEAYIGMKRPKEAIAHLAQGDELLQQADTWHNRHRLTDLQYQLALAQGRWEEALTLLKRIKDQGDSVNLARLDIQMARMQVTYQLDQKEQDNADLRTENARHAELIASEQLNNKYLLGMLVLLTILVTALFFTSRHSFRMVRRMKLKNEVIRKQHDEIHGKNLELKRQNMRLAETLVSEEEKEMMLKEIHHRVKNDLQVVDSLLQIQGAGCADPDVGRVLKEAQGRIRSMAMVHEHIYRTAGDTQGDLKKHMEQLTRSILVAHGSHDKISVSVEAAPFSFPTETLMPLTLVVNELFTNAVKYAFTGRESGHVTIVVRAAGEGYELLFSDDGVGIENGTGSLRARSFGMELVEMLAGQLNGGVRFLKGQGTTVSLTFAPDKVALRLAS
jgi:two-component sensor histidine kinase